MPTHERAVTLPEDDVAAVITLLGSILTQSRAHFTCPFCDTRTYKDRNRAVPGHATGEAIRERALRTLAEIIADPKNEGMVMATTWTPWNEHKPDCAAREAYYLRERLLHPEMLAALDPAPPF